MSVELLFTLICDDVRIENTGKIIIVGLYDRTIGFVKPKDATGEVKYALPALYIFKRWRVSTPALKAKTELVDPTGKSVTVAETELLVSPDNSYHNEIIRIAGIILIEGPYTIRTTVLGDQPAVNEVQFEVIARPVN